MSILNLKQRILKIKTSYHVAALCNLLLYSSTTNNTLKSFIIYMLFGE